MSDPELFGINKVLDALGHQHVARQHDRLLGQQASVVHSVDSTGKGFIHYWIPNIHETVSDANATALAEISGKTPAEISHDFATKLGERFSRTSGLQLIGHAVDEDGHYLTFDPKVDGLNDLHDHLAARPKDRRWASEFLYNPPQPSHDRIVGVHAHEGPVEMIESYGHQVMREMVNELPPTDLATSIKNAHAILPGGEHDTRAFFLKTLEDNPEGVQRLDGKLKALGIDSRKLRYVSQGRGNIVLETTDGMIIKLGANNARHFIPHQWQALHSFDVPNFRGDAAMSVEIMSKLNIADVTNEHLAELQKAVRQYPHPDPSKMYVISDPELRNIGLGKDGIPYYLDGDGIEVFDRNPKFPADATAHAKWVGEDGKWRQYSTYQAEHAALNSHLHQASGGTTAAQLADNIVSTTPAPADNLPEVVTPEAPPKAAPEEIVISESLPPAEEIKPTAPPVQEPKPEAKPHPVEAAPPEPKPEPAQPPKGAPPTESKPKPASEPPKAPRPSTSGYSSSAYTSSGYSSSTVAANEEKSFIKMVSRNKAPIAVGAALAAAGGWALWEMHQRKNAEQKTKIEL